MASMPIGLTPTLAGNPQTMLTYGGGGTTGLNPQALPSSAKITMLDQRHPEYQVNRETWDVIDLLYRGGVAMRQNAGKFLRKRPKELADVYAFRCSMFSYQNILGSGIDYYLASVFRKNPEVSIKQKGPDGLLYDIPDIPDDARYYYLAFQENCDTKGNTITDFFREVLKNILLYKTSWIMVDLPSQDVPVVTRMDQLGVMPYVVNFGPQQVINWSEDQYGNLEWVVIKVELDRREWLKQPMKVTRWYKFDRQYFEIYEAASQWGMDSPDPQSAKLVDNGYHALAELNQVPVMRVQVPEGLWLGNRVLPQVLDHLNSDNAYQFALFMSNLAMPVIIGKAQQIPVLSEAGFLQLPEGSQIAWTEPGGASFERSESRVQMLREEIYRQMYLMAQGRSSDAMPAVQSGYSKELEMAPAGEVANLLGDILRVNMQRVLNFVAHVRGDPVQFSVRGFERVLEQPVNQIGEALQYQQLGIQSETATREMAKKVIRACFSDHPQSELERMFQEVDAAPTQEEMQAQQEQQQQEQFQQQFQQQLDAQGQQQQQQSEIDAESREHEAEIAAQQKEQDAEIEAGKREHEAELSAAQREHQAHLEERKAKVSHGRELEKGKHTDKQAMERLKFTERNKLALAKMAARRKK